MNAYKEITRCRVSGDSHLVSVLNLGYQALTGIFPANAVENVTLGPLELVWCPQSGLLQLKHSYNADEMYGDNYGYRSGLNQSMVSHLTDKVRYLERVVPRGALEQQVLDEVRDTGALGTLIPRANPDPVPERNRPHAGEPLGDDPDPARQRRELRFGHATMVVAAVDG